MSLEMMLYLVDVVGSLEGFTGFLAFLSFFGLVVSTIINAFIRSENRLNENDMVVLRATNKIIFISVTLFALTSAVTILIPEKSTLYTIVGISTAKEILNNEKVGEIGDKALKVLNQKLDEMIEDKK